MGNCTIGFCGSWLAEKSRVVNMQHKLFSRLPYLFFTYTQDDYIPPRMVSHSNVFSRRAVKL